MKLVTFDDGKVGRLSDETSRQQIAELLAALAEWTGRLRGEAVVVPVEPTLAVVH